MPNAILASRWFHFVLLFGLLLGAVHFGGSNHPVRKDLQYAAFDALNEAYPRERSDDVIIVDIDDDSLERLGQWPWPRPVLADLLVNLKALGAEVVAFDGVLAEPDSSSPARLAEQLPEGDPGYDTLKEHLALVRDHDEILAGAIRETGIFISAFTYGSYSQVRRTPRLVRNIQAKTGVKDEFLQHAQSFGQAAVFLPVLEEAAAGNGSFMALPEHDGILRKTGLIFTNGKDIYPSLSLEALRVGLLGRKGNIRIGETPLQEKEEIDTDYRLVIGDHVIPVERDGILWVYFRPFSYHEDYVSAYKIARPEFHDEIRNKIKGRIVFIGSSAEGLKDLRNTPLGLFRPGVEIHANVAEQILQDKYLLRPNISQVVEQAFIFVVGLMAILLAPFVNVMVLAMVCATLIGMIVLGSVTAYTEYGVLLDPVYPSLSVLVIFVVSTILAYLRVETERRHVRQAFGLYISPDFMKELTKSPDKLKLGGEIRELSVMFTDIRKFTSISEGLAPEELIQLMNDFLTPMSDLVMQNRGTIDKYMGDAMMAFWNAPLDDPDHALHACRAALHMRGALEPINAALAKKAEGTGREPLLLSAGIGINTGPCAVGNMGSKQRFAYSALGDAVNLASRLEGQTKTYGVDILLGEATAVKVPQLATLELDLIRVVGKAEPVRVHTLLGDEGEADDEAFRRWKTHHDLMIRCYRNRDLDRVFEAAGECLKLSGGRLSSVYHLYQERAAEMLRNPPKEGWDGVYAAKSK